jgi:hypothetical protein
MRPNIMVGFEIARILIIIGRCDPYRTVPGTFKQVDK